MGSVENDLEFLKEKGSRSLLLCPQHSARLPIIGFKSLSIRMQPPNGRDPLCSVSLLANPAEAGHWVDFVGDSDVVGAVVIGEGEGVG